MEEEILLSLEDIDGLNSLGLDTLDDVWFCPNCYFPIGQYETILPSHACRKQDSERAEIERQERAKQWLIDVENRRN